MSIFRRHVVVDWSGNARPKTGADSIWVSHPEPTNPRTRAAAFHHLLHLLRRVDGGGVDGRGTDGPVLLGFDFPLGYPRGFATAAALAGPGAPWERAWQHLSTHLRDADDNTNNRWQVAADLNTRLGALWFWGVAPTAAGPHLTRRKPFGELVVPELRHVEECLRAANWRPFPTRHLLGAGSVGSQTLTGIPIVQRLRTHPELVDRVLVWPFETGLGLPPLDASSIVVAEIWPTLVAHAHIDHPVKDARQVTALSRHLAALDADGTLATLFTPDVAAAAVADVVAEEGWVLGVA